MSNQSTVRESKVGGLHFESAFTGGPACGAPWAWGNISSTTGAVGCLRCRACAEFQQVVESGQALKSADLHAAYRAAEGEWFEAAKLSESQERDAAYAKYRTAGLAVRNHYASIGEHLFGRPE